MTDTLDIEKLVASLKAKAIDYDNLSDDDKLIKLSDYDKMISDKKEYMKILDNLKWTIDDNYLMDTICATKDIPTIIQKINTIKEKMHDNNMSITELINLHTEMTGITNFMTQYFNIKKLEIIHM